MNMRFSFSLGFVFVLFFLPAFICAQQTVVYDNPDASFKTGLDLIEKKQFGAASQVFEKMITQLPSGETVMLPEARYYAALCDYKLGHPQAKEKFGTFISDFPNHTKTNRATLNLGMLEYDNRKYKDAIVTFEKVDNYRLSPDQRQEYLYKLGFSYLKTDNFSKAREAFFPILNTPGQYQNPSIFNYAHLAYMDKNYDQALLYFKKVENDPAYSEMVPFYLIQINYINKNYDEIIKIGPDLLKSDKIKDKKKLAEAHRIVGKAFYEKAAYAEALPYFEKYAKTSGKSLTRSEYYEFGYANYKAGNFEKAIDFFQKAIKDKDQLSQSAQYYLSDCYLKTDQKQFAQKAFFAAYELTFDMKIREDALFNYAKLSYELSYDPYDQAIGALKNYINDYPESPRIDEAYAYLSKLFLSTKNYQSAIDAIEGIKGKSNDLRAAYQKITYLRGIQLFNGNKFDEALKNFKKSLSVNADQKITALAKFWIGETHYKMKDNFKAIDYYEEFMTTPGASKSDIFPMVNYNLGYAHFNLEHYDEAIVAFRQFINKSGDIGINYVADAQLRTGDCFFVTQDYAEAIQNYDRAISRNAAGSDYATYQKALSQGALGQRDKKIGTLKQISTLFPRSSYLDDASFEIAQTYLLMGDNSNALEWFNQTITNFPNSSYLLRSQQKTGLIYYNQNQYDLALDALKKVVTKYPGTTESKEALATIKNIYMDKNAVDEYFAFVKNVPNAGVSVTEQDSLTYIAAENLYMNNNCEEATAGFSNYISNFPAGAFSLQANFYKAECDFNSGKPDAALPGYEFVIAGSKSQFTEKALLRASAINFEKGKYSEALGQYKALQLKAEYAANITKAIEGEMECSFRLGDAAGAIDAAYLLLDRENLDNEQVFNARFIIAKSAMVLGKLDVATKEFEKTAALSGDEKGAESQYMLAEIQFQQKNYPKAETLVFDLANHFAGEEFWKAKGFILLADIYNASGNVFQARQTLQSIIDNYDGADLKEIATQKLAALEKN
jgi:TolA-binding protein